MGRLLLLATLATYPVGVLLAIAGTTSRSAAARRGSTVAFSVAWVLHLAVLVQHGRATGVFPLSNVTEFLLVLGWIVLTLYLVVWFRYGVLAAGIVLPTLAALLAVPALWPPVRQAAEPYPGEKLYFVFHTTIATTGLAATGVAFAMSLIYLVQDRALKSRRAPRLLARLPSLESSDRIGHLALVWGFSLLTLGIATGVVWNLHHFGRLWSGGAKQIFPLLAWLVFAGLLYARVARGLGGRRSAYLTIAGFALGLLTALGMSF